jgi:hypothetical protein
VHLSPDQGEGLARFATPTQSLVRSTLFKGERSLKLSRQEKARATERTCQLFCRTCALPLTRSILRLTVCRAADSLSPLSDKELSKSFNSPLSRIFLYTLLHLKASWPYYAINIQICTEISNCC